MASLGRVCAVGIGANMIISVFLLPAWWVWLSPKSRVQSPESENGDGPSRAASDLDLNPQPSTLNASLFYRAGLWRFGLAVVRILPAGLVKGFSVIAAGFIFSSAASAARWWCKISCPSLPATAPPPKRPPTGSIGNSP